MCVGGALEQNKLSLLIVYTGEQVINEWCHFTVQRSKIQLIQCECVLCFPVPSFPGSHVTRVQPSVVVCASVDSCGQCRVAPPPLSSSCGRLRARKEPTEYKVFNELCVMQMWF